MKNVRIIFLSLLILIICWPVMAQNKSLIRRGNIVMAKLDRIPTVNDSRLGTPPAMAAWQQWAGDGEQMTTAPDHVDPLLSTQWGQNSPYNTLCPTINDTVAPTGCVATAMAQIIYYWHPYLSGYDWSLMLPNYTNYYGQQALDEQKQAVAQLMVDCGTTVKMKYGTTSSSANVSDVPLALVKNFGFNHGTRYVYRKYMTYAEWAELLRAELRAGRPVLYRGGSSSVAHAFIIDGFNEEGYFHVNWGWYGVSDGWFRFTALNPENKGTGGGSSKDGFNYQQGMLLDLAPDTVLHTDPAPVLYADSLTYAVAVNGSDSLSLRGIKNLTNDTLKGKLCLAVYHNGELVNRVRSVSMKYAPNANKKQNFSSFKLTELIPGDVYEIMPQWKNSAGSGDWQPVISMVGYPIVRTVTALTDTTLSWAPNNTHMGHPVLLSQDDAVFAKGNFADLKTVWTVDSSEWNGWVMMALVDSANNFQELYDSGIDLRYGSSDTLHVRTNTITLPVGRYAVYWGYYTGNQTGLVWLPCTDSVDVVSITSVNRIYYTDDYAISDTLLTDDNPNIELTLRLTLASTASVTSIFTGTASLAAYYDTYPKPGTRLYSLSSQLVSIVGKDTVQYHVVSDLANQLPAGRYRLMLRYLSSKSSSYVINATSSPIYVTIQHATTSLNTVEDESSSATKFFRDGNIFILRNGSCYTIDGRVVNQ